MQILEELKRRNVVRIGVAYLVSAWLILQVAELLASIEVLPVWLPRILFYVLALGFAAALILAWVFELTEKGIQREVDAAGLTPRISGRHFDFIIMGLMALALSYFMVDKFMMPGDTSTQRQRSVAVLPFKNRSNVADDAFFVDGIHDDILTQLANLSGLDTVISRTSVEQYRDTDKRMIDIGQELGVANILEGGVQRAGNRVRINMQLIDSTTDEHVWAETYDRELTVENIFAIQSEISREIVVALHGVLTDTDEARLGAWPTRSMEAYGEYVLGRDALFWRTVESSSRARAHFEKAIVLDPEYALAYVGLADAMTIHAFLYGNDLRDEILPERLAAIEKALELNPLLGEAYASYGLYQSGVGRLDESIASFQRAIELSPGYATAHQWYSHTLTDLERYEDALASLDRAIELDPLQPVIKINKADTLRRLGRADEALEVLMLGVRQNPNFATLYDSIGRHHWEHDNIADALRWIQVSIRLSPGTPIRIRECMFLLQLGDADGAKQCYAGFVEEFPGEMRFMLTDIYMFHGEFERALDDLENTAAADSAAFQHGRQAWILIELGDIDEARARLNQFVPQFFGDESLDFGEMDQHAATMALHVLRAEGNDERLDYIYRGLLTNLESQPISGSDGIGFGEVTVHLAAGHAEPALSSLRAAIDAGARRFWWRLSFPDANWMKQYPEWNAMIEELETDIGRQREWYAANQAEPLF